MKRAVIYSLLSVVMAGFLFLIFWSTLPQPVVIEGASVTSRITFLNDQLSLWDTFINEATKAATREALNYLTLGNGFFVQPDPTYTLWTVPEVQDALSECLRTGTQSLVADPSCYPDPQRSLTGRLAAYKDLVSRHMNVDLDWSLSNITITDFQPFLLRVDFELNTTLNDSLFAFWNLTRTYTVLVSVEGLPDPLFKRFRVGGGPNGQLLQTEDTLRFIRQYPVPRPVMSKENVTEMIAGKYFAADKRFAPTYLQRLAGIYDQSALDPDANAGIETLTNLTIWDNLPNNPPHYAEYNLSYTGHQMLSWYKTGGSPKYHCAIEGGTYSVYGVLPHDFRMEAARLARYNIDNASDYNLTCEQ